MTLTPCTQRQSLTVVSHGVDDGAPTPALLHSTWQAPKVSKVVAARASTDSGSDTSVTTPTTRWSGPAVATSPATAASTASARTSLTTTCMPSACSSWHSARPMPPAPPVTTATLPVRSCMCPCAP